MKYLIFAIFVYATCWGHGQCGVNITRVVAPLLLSEGPHWDQEKGYLFYVDTLNYLVNRYDPSSGEYTAANIGGKVSIVIPVRNTTDQFVVTRGRDICVITWDGRNSTQTLQPRVIATLESNVTTNRIDDGKADTVGRLWTGTMGPEPTADNIVLYQGNFYSLDFNTSEPVLELRNVSISNGIAWNAKNNIMYYIDSPTKKVVAFDFNVSTASIDNERTIFDFTNNSIDGYPDGMTIDSDENLWVACYGCGKVLHVNPRTGELIGSVHVPVTWVTSVTFGGSALDTLYVTTARVGLYGQENDTMSGSLFAVTGLGVTALAPANKAVL